MSPDRQTQRGGQNSTQVQNHGSGVVVVHQGISEERVRDLMREDREKLKGEFAIEARAMIDSRLQGLDDRLLPALAEHGALESFADPAFVRAYRKAQNGAAASERESDYDMLTALLTERTANPMNRKVNVGIDRSIEILDQIDDDALRAITISVAMDTWSPVSGSIQAGIDVLESLFSQLLDGPLPLGSDWLDQLDILDVVRLNNLIRVPTFDEFYMKGLAGYAAPGMLADEAPKNLLLGDPYPPMPLGTLIVDHELRPGYVRVAAPNIGVLEKLLRNIGHDETVVNAVVTLANDVFGFQGNQGDTPAELMRQMRLRPTLRAIAEWRDQIPLAYQSTVVGRTLANANAKRLDAAGHIPLET